MSVRQDSSLTSADGSLYLLWMQSGDVDDESMKLKQLGNVFGLNRNLLQTVSLIAAIVGGLGSVCLMLMSGMRPPVFLIVLFTGWVLAPFAGLILAAKLAQRWSSTTRNALYALMPAIAICSLAIYGYVLVKPPISQPAFPYVAVPLVSWLGIAITIGLAALLSRANKGEISKRGLND